MSDYIDKTAARRAALAPCNKCWKESGKTPVCDGCKLYGVAQAIDRIPAADVRPVVLCRDCKYWFNAPVADGFNSCELDALIRHEDFFCAAGGGRGRKAMKKHELKILPQYFQAVWSGIKTFELRKDDRDYQRGDILVLREWDGEKYTGSAICVKVTYILQNAEKYGLKDGYIIMGIRHLEAADMREES